MEQDIYFFTITIDIQITVQFALLKERIPLFALLVKSGESDSFFYKEQEEQCRLICYFVLGIKGEKHGEKTKFDANHS